MLVRPGLSVVLVGILTAWPVPGQSPRLLEYAPSPVDNPLKGLVPYQGDVRDRFPHSLEFNYLAYADLVKGYEEFNWKPLESLLDDVASRGHQTVLRIYLEYPGKKGTIPEFLLRDGLKVHRYLNTNTQPLPPAQVETPDYEDTNLRRSLKRFLAAFGNKYDGDPRLGFITAGLLGTWGEWHTYPREELFASKAVQTEVMDAYQAAFSKTPVLLRYPAGPRHDQLATNADRPFGYHDDSFAWATLATGKKSDSWFFMSALKAAGPRAESKWKTHPIGGEIRPEAWGRVFDENPGLKEVQNFRQCIEATHATWLMDSGMFRKKSDPRRIERAQEEVRRMGYEFQATSVTLGALDQGHFRVRLEIKNLGVAPFYHAWPAQWGLLAGGKPKKTWPASGRLSGLLPGDPPREWTDKLDTQDLVPGVYTLAVQIPNPLPRGKPVRFANKTQDRDASGWLSLGEVRIGRDDGNSDPKP